MPSDPEPGVIRLVVPSTPQDVREALRSLFNSATLGLLPEAEKGAAEIVLAEVLNNIVEHAYASAHGEIEVTIGVAATALHCKIIDHGARMPDDTLPAGVLPKPHMMADLPEGGFGWHLIRALASNVEYRRIGDRNELSFRLNAQQ